VTSGDNGPATTFTCHCKIYKKIHDAARSVTSCNIKCPFKVIKSHHQPAASKNWRT